MAKVTVEMDLDEDLAEPVRAFAGEMAKQLHLNREKGHWDQCDIDFLLSELKNKTRGMERLLKHPMRPDYRDETCDKHQRYLEWMARMADNCADVANFSMMIWDETVRQKRQP